MNKFGIFNLLNSFLNLSGSAGEQTKPENADPTTDKTDFLNGILSGLSGKTDQAKKVSPTEKPTPTKQPIPLQRQMLNTIISHDQIVSRVKAESLNKK